LEGFYDIIPKRLISIFNEQELELLISGLPNIDIEDLRANTEYHKYQANSIQVGFSKFSIFFEFKINKKKIQTDSMVLASTAQFRSSGACKIPAICDWYIEGSTTRIWSARGHEWHTEIPNSPRRSINGSLAVGPHLVSLIFPLFLNSKFYNRFHLALPIVSTNWICPFTSPTISFVATC
jgi:hypothetical protein